MSGSGRSKKLRIVREYLMNEGRDLDVVVFSDATDVLANAGTLREVEEHLEGDQLLVAGDLSCWIGAVCDEVEAANLRRALPGHFENRGLFANSGQYVGSRTAVLRFVDWAVGQLDAKEVTRELANLLSPSRIAEMKAGRFDPSDQCLLHAYWASYPERVRIDSHALVFASFKRFYVLEADDRGVRTPGRQADGQGQAATLRWQPLAPAAWPKASPFSDKPLVACKELELPVKRFIDGPGYYCDDYDHVAGKFKWRCNQAGAARMLVYKGGANNTTRPLLGWHANGQRVGVEHFRHISRRRRRIDGVVGDSRRRRGERGRIRVELVPGRHRDAIDAARASRQPTQKQRRHATMELFHAVLLELCHAPCQHDDR